VVFDAVVAPSPRGAAFLIRDEQLGSVALVRLDHRGTERFELDDESSSAGLELNELSIDVYWRQPDGNRCIRSMRWPTWTGPAVCGPNILQRESGRDTMVVYGPGYVEVRTPAAVDDSRLRLPIEAAGPECEFADRRDALFVACPTPMGVQAAMYDVTGGEPRYWDLPGTSMLPAPGERMIVLREGDRVFGHPGAGCGELRIPDRHEVVSWTMPLVLCPAILLRRPNGGLYVVDLSPERPPTPPELIRRVWAPEAPAGDGRQRGGR
jgi:hypothetical protein